MAFKKIDPKLNLPEEEERVLKFWKENDTFKKSLKKQSPKGNFVFYEGPPTANGKPGLHHVEARSFKDLFARYKTMKGYYVKRKAGWDTHGLPVELQVEKELEISGKSQIESLVPGDKKQSIKKFNELCKKSVWRYKDDWEKLTERMAYWIDMDDPYITYDPNYIESVWNIILEIDKKGLLYKGHKVVPYCPRCGTALSSHEVAQGYKEIKEESIYIKLKSTKFNSHCEEEQRSNLSVEGLPCLSLHSMARNDSEQIPIENTYFLVWTTTPWTLSGNAALAVNNKVTYCKVKLNNNSVMLNLFQHPIADEEILKPVRFKPKAPLWGSGHEHSRMQVQDDKVVGEELTAKAPLLPEEGLGVVGETNHGNNNEYFILAKNRVETVFQGLDYEIIEELSGKEIVERYSTDGQDYEPIYPEGQDFSEGGDKVYKLITADYVSDNDGTGIVHIAPAFGADDYTWGYQKNGIKVLKTVDERGTQLAGAGKGSFVKKADKEIKEDLEARNILFKKESITHDYPFCWRCDSPLLYLAKDSWFIKMSVLRDKLLKNNEKINWNPAYIKHGRFGKWLENVEDWAISRDRYWGTPLPVWECEKCKKYKVVGSFKDLEKSDQKEFDPHKPYIDEVEFDCECGGKMKRAPEVMDVWLDSGAMPFAQYHYPFENKELFEEQFPSDFICEAVDQTRGWFYTLLAISTILKEETPYKNAISVGLVLDAHGKKMSKSLGNIVVPEEVFQKFGADVIRYYFYSVNQPGDSKLFSEKEVVSLSRNLFLTLWNVFSFFMTYASIDNFKPSGDISSKNVLDKWIMAKYQELVNEVTASLDKFDPYKSSNQIIGFVSELSTWYVRRSRRRFWKSENDTDKLAAYETLYYVLKDLSKLLAPFAPMYSEKIYLELRDDNDLESVHLTDFPQERQFDKGILHKMSFVRKIVEEGLSERASAGIKVRQPLSKLRYSGEKLDQDFEDIIAEEVNVKKIEYADKLAEMKNIQLDVEITPELQMEGDMRDLIRNIQALRKKSQFEVEDRISLYYFSDSKEMNGLMTEKSSLIAKEVLAKEVKNDKITDVEASEEFRIGNKSIWIGISRIRG